MEPPRVDILGVGISAVNTRIVLATIEGWIEHRRRHYICVTGVHGVMESQKSEELRAIHNRSGLTVPDGMPMVWCGHWSGFREMSRTAGPDLMLDILALAARKGWRSYLYGGKEGVPERLAERLQQEFPDLKIVGTYSPPFRPLEHDEVSEVARMINATRPDIVWVGLSTPKQEYWMARFTRLLDASALIGVGAAFDFHAGLAPRAPNWMQRTGLEWLYRLVSDPRRLWRRYLVNNPRFLTSVLQHRPRAQRRQW